MISGGKALPGSQIFHYGPVNQPLAKTTESQVESKTIKERMTTTIEISDTFDKFLEKHKLYKFLRITAWIKRFVNRTKHSGPLETDDIKYRKKIWIKREHESERCRKV